MSDGKLFNGLSDKILKDKKQKKLEMQFEIVNSGLL